MFLYIIIILCLFCKNLAFAKEADQQTPGVNGTQSQVQFYRNLFKVKRKEQVGALERILVMENLEKQANMIDVMLKTIIKTIRKSKKTLELSGFKPGDPFPEKDEVKDALSIILENTAFFTDLLVRFPTITKVELYKNAKTWKDIVVWARDVSQKSGVFVEGHEKILYSLGQEMQIDDPDPDYINPFRVKVKEVAPSSEDRAREYEEKKRKEKLNKKKRKNKPKLSPRNEL